MSPLAPSRCRPEAEHDAREADCARSLGSERERLQIYVRAAIRRRPDRRVAVQIEDDHVVGEGTAARDRRPASFEHAAPPVEDEVVVAAELVT